MHLKFTIFFEGLKVYKKNSYSWNTSFKTRDNNNFRSKKVLHA